MTDVALVGGDGAGKSSVAAELARSLPVKVRTLYMGVNPASSKVALPTTRLVHALKVRKAGATTGTRAEAVASLHGLEHRRDDRGRVWAAARLVNRMAEEILRLLVSRWHQLRGAVVLYDRHFLFDFTPASGTGGRLSSRIHLWFLEHVYPKPDLVILLDAPADVLVARKQEVPESYLDKRRGAFLARGATMPNFVVVDASRPFDQVCAEVGDLIMGLVSTRRSSSEGTPTP